MQMTTPSCPNKPTMACARCCGEIKEGIDLRLLVTARPGDCPAGKCSNLSEILSRPQLFAKVTVTTDCRSRERLHLRDSWGACLCCLPWLGWGFTCSTAVSWPGPSLSSPKLSVQPHNWSTQSAVPVNPTPILGTGFWRRCPIEQPSTRRPPPGAKSHLLGRPP